MGYQLLRELTGHRTRTSHAEGRSSRRTARNSSPGTRPMGEASNRGRNCTGHILMLLLLEMMDVDPASAAGCSHC